MDIDLARTFMEVVRTGSFMAAAERLHVTQTAVTARIRNLESQLGCRLFVRNRSGARLTVHGERFVVHASQLVSTWDTARRELPMPREAGKLVTLGGEISLWNPLLLNWMAAIRQQCPSVALRTEIGERRTLHQKLEQGLVDAALVHQPDYWPGMQVEELLEEKLILVRSSVSAEPYLYVDWGEHFCRQHDAALPEYARSALSTDLGPLALHYLVRWGGSGYFRTRVAQPYLEQGLLQRDTSAPEFSYPVYLVFSRERASEQLYELFEVLREQVVQLDHWVP
jgi:DNA-binding transcriptional LysR family regulator